MFAEYPSWRASSNASDGSCTGSFSSMCNTMLDGYSVVREMLGNIKSKASTDSTMSIRIISIFCILASGLIGGLPPLFIRRWQKEDDLTGKLLRAFSGGVILALGLVHIAPEAIEALDSLHDGIPLGGTVITAGVLLLLFSECCFHNHMHSHGDDDGARAKKNDNESVVDLASQRYEAPSPHRCNKHQAMEGQNMRLLVTAYTMEFGCVFHSFVIGLGLGVTVSDSGQVVALLIALVFHQLLEAISLGSMLGLAKIRRSKAVLMIVTYSLTIPIGIVIGILISDSYNPDSSTARAVEGSLNGISAGMLLYISILQLLGEEFSRPDVRRVPYLRWLLFVSALLGAASMILLAKWA